MKIARGVYGPDDVTWEVQDGRDRANEAYRQANKILVDSQDRLAAKKALLFAHEQDGGIYQDSDNALHLGFERNGSIYVFGAVDFANRSIRFAPLTKAARYMVLWAPFSKTFAEFCRFNMIAPAGCI